MTIIWSPTHWQWFLISNGFETFAVYVGKDAIQRASLRSFDFMITDVMMAPIDGIETALLMSHICQECRVLLMSGNERAAAVLLAAQNDGHQFEILRPN